MVKHTQINNRILWILAALFLWAGYIDLAIAGSGLDQLMHPVLASAPDAVAFAWNNAGWRITGVAVFMLMCLVVRKNRFMLETVRPTLKKRSLTKLGTGMLIGFLVCMFCILCAMVHGDIRFNLEFSASQIPFLLFALICVFFQSTSEELWFRTFLYERINVHYPLWVAIAVNSALFGAYHLLNADGVTPLFIANTVIIGVVLSLLRWYTNSIWTCMGFHTMWNFTQVYVFDTLSAAKDGFGIFHASEAEVSRSLFYDGANGADGALPSVFICMLLCVVILMIMKKRGRLAEMLDSRESRGEMPAVLTRSRSQKVLLTIIILAFASLMVMFVGSDILGLFYHKPWWEDAAVAVAAGCAIFIE